MTELKPCPFCGSKTIIANSISTGGYWGHCTNCCSVGRSETSKEKAIDAWNRRAEPPNKPLTIEELKEMVEEE